MCSYGGPLPDDKDDLKALIAFAEGRAERAMLIAKGEPSGAGLFWRSMAAMCHAKLNRKPKAEATVDPMASFPYPDPKPSAQPRNTETK